MQYRHAGTVTEDSNGDDGNGDGGGGGNGGGNVKTDIDGGKLFFVDSFM